MIRVGAIKVAIALMYNCFIISGDILKPMITIVDIPVAFFSFHFEWILAD